MDYQIIWDDEALAELTRIIGYIASDNPTAARKFGERILERIKQTGAFPRLGKIYPKLHREDVREIPLPPYRIIYHVKDAERRIRILKLWHGSREEPQRLPEL